jgi:ATP-dependent DNA helicase RecG
MKETQHTEWKESWRDEYLKWISGFANAEGGVLVIGRNDKGKAMGAPEAKKLLVDLPNKVRDVLGILVKVNLRREAGKELVEIVVDPYPYPVSYKGEYHVRSGSTKQELKGAALDRFLLSRQGKRWDGVPVPRITAKDLDVQSLKRFRDRAAKSNRLSAEILKENDAHLIDKLHLVDGAFLKRAAVLLFHADPERFVTGAYVKIGFFKNDGELLYHDEVHGSLFAQVDGTMDLLLTKYLKAAIGYEGVQRTETYPVPEQALREALLNAIAHKDYGSGIPIQISVYDDHLSIWNNGPLQQGWTIAKLRGKHASQPPNPDIANAFFRAGMIESWGLGIEKMRQACLERRLPAPKLREEEEGLWVEFGIPARVKTPVQMSVEMSVETPVQILDYLRKNPTATLTEAAAAIGKTVRTAERVSARLVKDGRLQFVGPRKNGRWKVLK